MSGAVKLEDIYDPMIIKQMNREGPEVETIHRFELKRKYGKRPAVYLDWIVPENARRGGMLGLLLPKSYGLFPSKKIDYNWNVKK